jgi:hypothetical protein
LAAIGMGRLAAASQRSFSPAIGIAGSSGPETTGRWTLTRAGRRMILDLSILRSPGPTGTRLCDPLAQLAERGPRHLRHFPVIALRSATVNRLRLG